MKFAELPIGARFKWFGKVYTKIAPSMAEEQQTRHCFIFGFGDFTNHGGESGQYEVGLVVEDAENPS